jgi:cytochrome c peroxidase
MMEERNMTGKRFTKSLAVSALTLLFLVGLAASALALTELEELGKHLFFDTNLSTPPGMSCASCHDPKYGWTGPDSKINAAGAVMPGVIHTRAGNRKPPTVAYGGDSPQLGFKDGLLLGGMFWDGRATGWTLGDPLQEQALGPFLNPVEMKNPNKIKVLVEILLKSTYADLFKQVYFDETGKDITPRDFDLGALYEMVGKAIAAYERSDEVNPFDSKFDDFWRAVTNAGLKVEDIDQSNWQSYKPYAVGSLTDQQLFGLAVFNDQGKCSACHVLTPSGPNKNKPPVFTDFSYDNLGIPKNLLNPFYNQPPKINRDGEAWVDPGLGGFLATTNGFSTLAAVNKGKHKVPTLRNVAKRVKWGTKPDGQEGWVNDPEFVKAYGHNGYFKSNFQIEQFTQFHPLQQILHFYNTRDVTGQGWPPPMPLRVAWPAPEVLENMNTTELGNLGLTPDLGMPILYFLDSLSDTSTPIAP